MDEVTLIHTSSAHQKKTAFLVQKIRGFFEKEGRMLFFFEHKEEGFENSILERQMNKQLYYIEEMLKKQITKN